MRNLSRIKGLVAGELLFLEGITGAGLYLTIPIVLHDLSAGNYANANLHESGIAGLALVAIFGGYMKYKELRYFQKMSKS